MVKQFLSHGYLLRHNQPFTGAVYLVLWNGFEIKKGDESLPTSIIGVN